MVGTSSLRSQGTLHGEEWLVSCLSLILRIRQKDIHVESSKKFGYYIRQQWYLTIWIWAGSRDWLGPRITGKPSLWQQAEKNLRKWWLCSWLHLIFTTLCLLQLLPYKPTSHPTQSQLPLTSPSSQLVLLALVPFSLMKWHKCIYMVKNIQKLYDSEKLSRSQCSTPLCIPTDHC